MCDASPVKYAWLVTRIDRPRNCTLVGVSHGGDDAAPAAAVAGKRRATWKWPWLPRASSATQLPDGPDNATKIRPARDIANPSGAWARPLAHSWRIFFGCPAESIQTRYSFPVVVSCDVPLVVTP